MNSHLTDQSLLTLSKQMGSRLSHNAKSMFKTGELKFDVFQRIQKHEFILYKYSIWVQTSPSMVSAPNLANCKHYLLIVWHVTT